MAPDERDDVPASSELEYEVPEAPISDDGPSSHDLDEQFPAGDPEPIELEAGPSSHDVAGQFPANEAAGEPEPAVEAAPEPAPEPQTAPAAPDA